MKDLLNTVLNIETNCKNLFEILYSKDFDVKKIHYTKELEGGLSYLLKIDLTRQKAFDIILIHNKTYAYQWLLETYFYDGVTDSDNKKYPFHDLDFLLSEIAETYEKDELKNFILHPNIVKVMKKSKRVREAVDFALE